MQQPAFLSYSRRDSVPGLQVATFLRDRGIKIWIDQLDIPAGAKWDTAIEHALRAAEFVVVLLSPNAVSSQNVLDEIGFALDEGKRVITVLLKPCPIPLRLRRYQYIDCTEDLEGGLARIALALGFVAPPAHGPSPTAAPSPAHSPPPASTVRVKEQPRDLDTSRSSAIDKTIALGGVSLVVGLVFAALGGLNAFIAATVGFGLFWLAVMTVPDSGLIRFFKPLLCVAALLSGVVLFIMLSGALR